MAFIVDGLDRARGPAGQVPVEGGPGGGYEGWGLCWSWDSGHCLLGQKLWLSNQTLSLEDQGLFLGATAEQLLSVL